jgi:transcription-repair coupling factor (superfamily II helicase)
MNLLTSAIRTDPEYGQLLSAVRRNFKDKPLPLLCNGLCEGAQDAMLVSLLRDTINERRSCALLICAEERDCVRLRAMFTRYGLRAAFYVGRDYNFHNITASHDYEHERLEVLFGLRQGTLDIVLTTPDAALGYTIPMERLDEAVLQLDFSTRVEPSVLASRLVAAGYARVDMVDGKGQFAVRGGIVDIYPTGGCYVDGDGELRANDALTLRKFLASNADIMEIDYIAADVDCDGMLTAKDQLRLRRMLSE